MLTVYRRHQARCPHAQKTNPREHTKCLCPVWVQGWVADKHLKESLGTRDWNAAQFKVREIEAAGFLPEPEEKPKQVTVKESIEKFFKHARARNLSPATLYKYTILLLNSSSETPGDFCEDGSRTVTHRENCGVLCPSASFVLTDFGAFPEAH